MASIMTRASLEEQYADIEAVLLQAIDGQDVREDMDADDGASVSLAHARLTRARAGCMRRRLAEAEHVRDGSRRT